MILRKYIDKAVIDCQNFFYDGITTKEIDMRLAQCVSQFSILEPELAYLGGWLVITSIEKDVASNGFNYTDNEVLHDWFVEKYNSLQKASTKEPKNEFLCCLYNARRVPIKEQ